MLRHFIHVQDRLQDVCLYCTRVHVSLVSRADFSASVCVCVCIYGLFLVVVVFFWGGGSCVFYV